MAEDFSERRNFVRFARILPVKIVNIETKEEASAQTHDLSAKGIGFITDKEMVKNSNLEIWVYIPDNMDPLHAVGRVAWSKKVGIAAFRVGVDLEQVDFVAVSRVIRLTN